MLLKANEAPHGLLLDLCRKIWTLAESQDINVSGFLDHRWRKQGGTMGVTCLHLAVLAGSVDLVTEFLQCSADPNLPGTCTEKAPIMAAASRGYTEILSLLLPYGARVNQVATNKRHALMFAAYSDQPECLKKLLQNGANVNLTCRLGSNALMNAALGGSLECVKALVGLGCGDQTDMFGESVLCYAAKSHATDVFKFLTQTLRPMLMDFSICEIIVVHDNEEMLQLAIELGFPLTGTEHSVLHTAAQRNSLKCLETLLDLSEPLNLDLSTPNAPIGESPLHRACRFGNPDAVLLLMEYGADTDEEDVNGCTPMFCCIKEVLFHAFSQIEVLPCIQNLIRFGCDLEKPTQLETQEQGFKVTPLEFAMAWRQLSVAKMLASAGAHKFSDSINSFIGTRPAPYYKHSNIGQELEHLKQWLRQPRSLMFLSCIAVRNILKRNIQEKILSLPLATHIKQYLNIPALGSIVETAIAKLLKRSSTDEEDDFVSTPSDSSDGEILTMRGNSNDTRLA